MMIKEYYLKQAQTGHSIYPVFRGNVLQKGYGLSNLFRRFYKWMIPILKEHALPVVKNVGKDLIKGADNVMNDVVDGKDFFSSSRSQLENIVKKLETGQEGQSLIKRKCINRGSCKNKKLKKIKSSLFKNF